MIGPSATERREYQRRRKQLIKRIGKRGVAIVPAAAEQQRNHDNPWPFRQSSDFYYLTGLAEPDALLVICPKRPEGEVIAFVHQRDPERERWEGPQLGTERAPTVLGIDQAFPIGEIDQRLPDLLCGYDKCYLPFADQVRVTQALEWFDELRRGARAGIEPPQTLKDVCVPLHELRLVKSAHEVDRLRRATAVSVEAHMAAARGVHAGLFEYEIAAILHKVFASAHGEPSFAPIVAGGENACVLHYRANAAELKDGDLVLIDAGAEVDYYAGDITRTWPVGGTFSKPQRALYQLVLDAQLAAIETIGPGVSFDAPHQAAVRVITEGLIELGLIEGPVEEAIEAGRYRSYFMHRTGHWLGSDVHDVGGYRVDGDWRELEPGMVMTVEPGIYVDPQSDAPEEYRGIGIRIEDDVLVTNDGHDVLTRGVPKEIDAIEALFAGHRDPVSEPIE
ncbi:MAG: aminopeptidase P N-terminal domain-containing protein [Halothiobacillaceae bacterium]|nr:aminopeptidase P N-terminal domain-containing protein [Halothiobacillaceae bacterium]HER35373.1 M24 family metallopeptidase [Halothiobacillaceae bacterium]